MAKYLNAHNGDVVDVTGDEAKRLDTLDNWSKVTSADAEKPLDKMNHDELAVVLQAEGIDKGEAETKAEIVAIIEAARED